MDLIQLKKSDSEYLRIMIRSCAWPKWRKNSEKLDQQVGQQYTKKINRQINIFMNRFLGNLFNG